MTEQELMEKMLAFIDTKDGDRMDEWYCDERGLYAMPLEEFAQFIGLELVVPKYIPKKTLSAVERAEMRKKVMRELTPRIEELFDMEFKRLEDEMKGIE